MTCCVERIADLTKTTKYTKHITNRQRPDVDGFGAIISVRMLANAKCVNVSDLQCVNILQLERVNISKFQCVKIRQSVCECVCVNFRVCQY